MDCPTCGRVCDDWMLRCPKCFTAFPEKQTEYGNSLVEQPVKPVILGSDLLWWNMSKWFVITLTLMLLLIHIPIVNIVIGLLVSTLVTLVAWPFIFRKTKGIVYDREKLVTDAKRNIFFASMVGYFCSVVMLFVTIFFKQYALFFITDSIIIATLSYGMMKANKSSRWYAGILVLYALAGSGVNGRAGFLVLLASWYGFVATMLYNSYGLSYNATSECDNIDNRSETGRPIPM